MAFAVSELWGTETTTSAFAGSRWAASANGSVVTGEGIGRLPR